jgi:hypothetical protein
VVNILTGNRRMEGRKEERKNANVVFFSVYYKKTLNLCSSLNASYQVTQPHTRNEANLQFRVF